MDVGSCSIAVTETSYFEAVWSKELFGIQAIIERGFTLRSVRDIIRTYTQVHRTDKYSRHSSIIWPLSLNSFVFLYEVIGFGFESSCSVLNIRFCACFEKGVP